MSMKRDYTLLFISIVNHYTTIVTRPNRPRYFTALVATKWSFRECGIANDVMMLNRSEFVATCS